MNILFFSYVACILNIQNTYNSRIDNIIKDGLYYILWVGTYVLCNSNMIRK